MHYMPTTADSIFHILMHMIEYLSTAQRCKINSNTHTIICSHKHTHTHTHQHWEKKNEEMKTIIGVLCVCGELRIEHTSKIHTYNKNNALNNSPHANEHTHTHTDWTRCVVYPCAISNDVCGAFLAHRIFSDLVSHLIKIEYKYINTQWLPDSRSPPFWCPSVIGIIRLSISWFTHNTLRLCLSLVHIQTRTNTKTPSSLLVFVSPFFSSNYFCALDILFTLWSI